MAKDAQSLVTQPTQAQHFTPPSGRELRAQALHRLQVGLFGLATMLLLVALANIIMDRARQSEAESGGPPPVSGKPGVSRDPLADIGVVPAADPSATPDPQQTQ